MLELTGPITVPGWAEPITSSNAAEILLFRQYERALDPARIDFLAAVTRELFDKLTTGRLPGPARIVDVLAPLVAERRIQLVAFDDAAADYLSRLRADSALPVPSVDALGLVTQNAAPSKLDWFLRRELRYELTVGADGESRGSIEVALRNEAPSGGLGPYFQDLQQRFPPGHNRQLVSIYSRLEATRVTVDGRRVDVVHTTERGRRVVAFFAEIPPGATTRIRVEVAGTLPVAGGRYAIRVDHQPTVEPDSIEVVLNGRTLVDGALRTPIDTIRRL